MDEPLHPRRAGTDPFGEPSPLPHEGSRVGFEHLGWTPGWRDHLRGALAGTTPGRAAATEIASSHDASRQPPSAVRRTGRRRRSGSSCTSWRAKALGQM